MSIVLADISARGVATVTLNRPEVGNAYNADIRWLNQVAEDAMEAKLASVIDACF